MAAAWIVAMLVGGQASRGAGSATPDLRCACVSQFCLRRFEAQGIEQLDDAVGGLAGEVGRPGEQKVVVADVPVDAPERLEVPRPGRRAASVRPRLARRSMSSSYGSTAVSSSDHAASVGST